MNSTVSASGSYFFIPPGSGSLCSQFTFDKESFEKEFTVIYSDSPPKVTNEYEIVFTDLPRKKREAVQDVCAANRKYFRMSLAPFLRNGN